MFIFLVIIGHFLLKYTKFGVQLKITGSSGKAARFSGINTEKIIGLAFVICALTATLGGLTITSLSRVGAWYNGVGYYFIKPPALPVRL